jgi:hypothetical protein
MLSGLDVVENKGSRRGHPGSDQGPQTDNDLPGRNWRLSAEIYLLPSSAKLNHSEFDPL